MRSSREKWIGHRATGALLALALVAAGIAACSPSDDGSRPATPPTPTVSFDPAQSSHLFPPANARPGKTPLIVLVPGGGWTSADPTGLTGLATWLSQRGAAVVTVTYRTSSDGAYFPVPAQDVACDVADAVARTRRSGVDVGDVVIVGHSAGAQLAAVVALTPGSFGSGCADPPVAPDRLVGLAGPYDVDHLGALASDLLGPGRHTAAQIAAANPVALATQRPQLPVLLIHGTADTTVPATSTEQLAAALTGAGHPVTTDYPTGVGHQSVYSAPVAGPLIAAWLGLAG
ncbi:alpha/beta fold hydrolase [Cellulomonas sp. NTE-D12]|uniref:alpha/beta hydrolase n=1 Tax=Cellulomonas sp. NTE-D12 TaxID=2962632 RepID=UPI0030813827|nr:esterase [Cellulomonas sp. NTE-D12]